VALPLRPVSDLLPGAEPWSGGDGSHGALTLHGFTGNPGSMRGLAETLAHAGFAVELPRLPGHGTTVEEMLTTRWDDWLSEVESAFHRLTARCERIVVVGQSMGGSLATWMAAHRDEVAGLVGINPLVEPPAPEAVEMLRGMVEHGEAMMPGVGSDIADPDVVESAYDGTPIEPLLSVLDALEVLAPRLGEIDCPTLIITSRQDHVVPVNNSEFLAERVAGPVERVWLERSYHVATMDCERDEVETRTVAFARKVTAGDA
jgi:carboxylesterase